MKNDQIKNPVQIKRSPALSWSLWKIRQKNKAAQTNLQVVDVVGDDGTVTQEQIAPRSPLS